jgi:hypothetical protein
MEKKKLSALFSDVARRSQLDSLTRSAAAAASRQLMMMVFSFITPAAVLQKDKSQRQRMLFYICVRCVE